MTRWLFLVMTALVGGCSCEIEPATCPASAGPRFLVDEQEIAGPLRFAAGGQVSVVVRMQMEGDEAPRVEVAGPFDVSASDWYEAHQRTVRSVGAGAGAIEAKDSCGRTSRLELEAVPVASHRIASEFDEWLAALPERITRNGVAVLPGGLFFGVDFQLLDAAGEPLAGTLPGFPVYETSGGIVVEPARDGGWTASVVGPPGPAVLTLEGAEPLELDVARGDEAVALEVWRNDPEPDITRWPQSWIGGAPVDGTELVLSVREIVRVGLHPFDAAGRLLVGIDVAREPLELDAASVETLSLLPGLLVGDAQLQGIAPGETTVVAHKAGASTTFRVRVVEPPAPD